MSKPELSEAEIEAAMKADAFVENRAAGNAQATPEGTLEITNENALIIMAQALIGIEKHLMAQVYLLNTRDPEKSGVTYIPSVFMSIYDGSDPFAEADAAVKAAAEMAKTDA